MRKISGRASALLLFVLIVLAGIAFYTYRFIAEGRQWVSYPSNKTVYTDGVLAKGTILDKNGTVLSTIDNGKRIYSSDSATRIATLHAVGDANGKIGTGALSAFASQLIGYNFITGAYSPTAQGSKLFLTIDASLNKVAYKALNGQKGAVGIVNYKTGEIICMVSAPSYDPENVPDFNAGGAKYEGVFINRFISSAYTPGSTFKLVTLAAAIENIPDLYDRTFSCEGSSKIGGDKITCTAVHGKLSIEDALAVSCNVSFAQLSLELGADKLNSYATQFGLTASQKIDTIKTAAGNFSKAKAGTADLAWSGIGQYNDTVCPANMLRYVAAIANNGVAVNMSLIHKTGLSALLPSGSSRLLSKATAEKLATMMNYDVYKTYGKDNFPGLELYAKSGTAEVGGAAQPHAWFVGYITNKNYPLAFVVVVENGGYGAHTAGAVANTVLQAAIKK